MNGYMVCLIYDIDDKEKLGIIDTSGDDVNCIPLNEISIVSILTHEQYENNSYKVVDVKGTLGEAISSKLSKLKKYIRNEYINQDRFILELLRTSMNDEDKEILDKWRKDEATPNEIRKLLRLEEII